MLFADPAAGSALQNQAPTAADQIFSIFVDASNGDEIGQFVANDADGQIVDYAISSSKVSISDSGLLTLKDNNGLQVGTPITATVIFADNIDGTGSALVTINVLQAPPNLPVISAPSPLIVVYPSDLTKLPVGHIAVQKWLKLWSAADFEGNPLEISFNIPTLLPVANSPFTIVGTAIDSESRVKAASSTITIQPLSDTNSLPVLTEGTPDHFEQRGSRYYLLDE